MITFRRQTTCGIVFWLFLLFFAATACTCVPRRSAREESPEESLLKARKLVDQGRYADAEKYFEMSLSGLVHRLDVYRELADVQVVLGRVREAEESLVRGLKEAKASDDEIYDAWLHLAEIRNRQGKHNEAVEALDEARRLDSGRPEAAWRMARLYETFKNPETARAIYGEAAVHNKGKPGETETLLRWASMEKRLENLGRVEVLLKKAVGLQAGNKKLRSSVYLALGEFYYEKARLIGVKDDATHEGNQSYESDNDKNNGQRVELLKKAEQAFMEASYLGSGKADVWLGRVLVALGKCDRAVQWLERAIENRPEDAKALGLMAHCLAAGETSKQDRKKAYDFALKSYTLSPEDPGIMMLLAELHLENGLEKPALDILDRLAESPVVGEMVQNNDGYWVLRGKALAASLKHKEALESFSRAVAISPDDRRVLRLQALSSARSGAYSRAVQSLRAVRKSAYKNGKQSVEKDLEVELQFAVSLEMTGARREAIEVLTRLEKKFPRNGFIPAYMGWIHLRAGRIERALDYARRAVEMEGESRLHSLDVLLQSQLAAGLFREAEGTAKRALQLAVKQEETAYFKKLLAVALKKGKKPGAESAP